VNRLLKNTSECFDRLSTNGKSSTISRAAPFALRFSKGERGIFQQPVKIGPGHISQWRKDAKFGKKIILSFASFAPLRE
jgi:hypothetical protein